MYIHGYNPPFQQLESEKREMVIQNVHLVYFSPCGGTENVIRALGRDIQLPKWEYNLTLPQSRNQKLSFNSDDLVFMGFPVYGGHMPRFFRSLVAHLHGSGTPLVMVAVYGNREYEGAFLDMSEGVSANGFKPVAAIAAVAQHSIAQHIAAGRPDLDDREKLAAFALKALDKAQNGLKKFTAPGAHRTWELPAGLDIFPNTDKDACTNCGQCAEVCPMGAISTEEPTATAKDKCVVCGACLKYCTAKARMFGNADTLKEYASHIVHAVVRKEAVIIL